MSGSTQTLEEIYVTAHEWRILMESDTSTAADKERFEAWINQDPRHAELFDKAVTIWAALGHIAPDDIDQELTNADTVPTAPSATTHSWLNYKKTSVVAGGISALAAIAILAGVYTLDQRPIEDQNLNAEIAPEIYLSEKGQVREITLSDGSVVTLGADSEVVVSFQIDARNIQLTKGAAMFDVASDPDRPFSVQSNKLTAKALGTIYEVWRKTDEVSVAVVEGEVSVSHPLMLDGKTSTLRSTTKITGGEIIVADTFSGIRPVQEVDIALIGAWRDHRLLYYGVPLRELVADVNRYSLVPIKLDDGDANIGDYLVRGAFDAKDLDAMLSSLEYVLPVSVDRSDNSRVMIRPDK
ncbi:MAG: FecR domain-containing protein [Pseudomonadota bacterium]